MHFIVGCIIVHYSQGTHSTFICRSPILLSTMSKWNVYVCVCVRMHSSSMFVDMNFTIFFWCFKIQKRAQCESKMNCYWDVPSFTILIWAICQRARANSFKEQREREKDKKKTTEIWTKSYSAIRQKIKKRKKKKEIERRAINKQSQNFFTVEFAKREKRTSELFIYFSFSHIFLSSVVCFNLSQFCNNKDWGRQLFQNIYFFHLSTKNFHN